MPMRQVEVARIVRESVRSLRDARRQVGQGGFTDVDE
jgi:hypothetical protein